MKCCHCQEEFSERKGTALWNTKIDENRAVQVAEHLGEGCSFKSTTRLVGVSQCVVKRLNKRLGEHGKLFHDERVTHVEVKALQADERHGFAVNKQTPMWEAEVIDLESRFVLSHVQGRRNEETIRQLLEDAQKRLHQSSKQNIALFTDGEHSYASLFPEIFGVPYQPARQGIRGRKPLTRYRIPRGLAHVQIIKHHSGRRLESIEIRYTHGSKKRIDQALNQLGFNVPNTSIIERRNGTARRMNASQVRKTLAFSRNPTSKEALGWWTLTVYNWCREHRSLKVKLDQVQGKKSINSDLQQWLSV